MRASRELVHDGVVVSSESRTTQMATARDPMFNRQAGP